MSFCCILLWTSKSNDTLQILDENSLQTPQLCLIIVHNNRSKVVCSWQSCLWSQRWEVQTVRSVFRADQSSNSDEAPPGLNIMICNAAKDHLRTGWDRTQQHTHSASARLHARPINQPSFILYLCIKTTSHQICAPDQWSGVITWGLSEICGKKKKVTVSCEFISNMTEHVTEKKSKTLHTEGRSLVQWFVAYWSLNLSFSCFCSLF